jgi:uncharacterized protein YciI
MKTMYAVVLAYDPADDSRLGLRPAHRQRLAGLASDGRLLAAGPWSGDTGALLIYRVDRREDLDAILAEDPYYSAPGVTVTAVEEWDPVTRHHALDGL